MGAPMKGLQVRKVRLTFKFRKNVTIKKTVELFVNDARDAVTMIPCDKIELLEETRLELMELLAIVLNKQARSKGIDLATPER